MATSGLKALPACADIVVSTDVLEHVDPGYILDALKDIVRMAIKAAFVTVATRPGGKIPDDGAATCAITSRIVSIHIQLSPGAAAEVMLESAVIAATVR